MRSTSANKRLVPLTFGVTGAEEKLKRKKAGPFGTAALQGRGDNNRSLHQRMHAPVKNVRSSERINQEARTMVYKTLKMAVLL